MIRARLYRSAPVAWIAVLTLVLPPGVVRAALPSAQQTQGTTTAQKPATGTQTPATGTQKPATATPAAAPATAAAPPAPPDGGWPRDYAVGTGGMATIFQPQVASWANQKHMVAWSAVSYSRKDAKEPALGTIKIEAETRTAPEERLVNFTDFKISESNFPSLSRDQTQDLVAGIQKAVPDTDRVIALDRVLANIDKSTIAPKDTPGVKADPPQVFHSERPAILINLDGDPIWSPIKELSLKYAVNTNWDLFQTAQNTYLVRNETSWIEATDLKGPWKPAAKLPPDLSKLPADENWKDVKANVPGKSIAASAVPQVFLTTTPSELLLLKGAPIYAPVTGTSLLWVNNTESDLFRLGKDGAFYYLIAGRWFSSPSLDGPWTFATPSLPADFKKIPLDHPRSRVLASVPGTDQAIEAVLLAQMPRTARVNIKQTKAPDVVYQGEPKFEPIESTTVSRAVNTDKDIIKVGDLYYMCFQAVWFMAKSPTGPWEVASTVPKQIYEIPASSPVNHVTYVTVEEDNDDEWVTFAYVAAYTGMMVAWGCTVWGSGWYYPPYVWGGGMYPGYYPYARTYGMSAWYNPWSGAYGRGYSAYGPYGGAGFGAAYNPRTGTYARGAAAYGPYGGRASAQAWNPRTGTYAQTRQGSNVYGNWGSSSVQRGDNWAQTGHVTNNRTGTTTSGIRTDSGAAAASRNGAAGRTTAGRTAGGDVYAGHDGNVYKKGSDGSWQSANTPQPNAADRARSTTASPGTRDPAVTSQLNRDSTARTQGTQRTNDWSSYQRSPSTSKAGSYGSSGASRSTGGASRSAAPRGGGGRRR